jgi:hypothetical protein
MKVSLEKDQSKKAADEAIFPMTKVLSPLTKLSDPLKRLSTKGFFFLGGCFT